MASDPDTLIRPVVDQRVVHRSGPFEVVAQRIRSENGAEFERTSIRHSGAVVILPLLETPSGTQVVMVRNERHAIGRWLEELPAGGIEAGETPEEAAARELREETGYRAATIEPLGWFYSSPGLTNERMEMFVATGLTHVGQDLDDGEVLTVHPVPAGDLLDRIDSGDVPDGKSMLCLLLARKQGYVSDRPCPSSLPNPE